MNKQTEALRLAIEALSQDEGWFEPEAAIKACKEALEQEQSFAEKTAQMSFMSLWDAYTTLKMKIEALEQPASKNIRESFNEMLEDKVAYYKGEQPAQWISVKDRLPEVKSGNAKEFIVVIYSGYTGRSFVTSRHFLNKMELYNEYSDNDFDEVSGWHERTYHWEYDDYYTSVDSCNADAVRYEVTHWMPLPDAPKEQA